MNTRKEYMASLPKYGTPESTKAHRAYYAQFVTDCVKDLVKARIGMGRLLASRDPNLNDIPLSDWDSIWMRRGPRGMWIEPGARVAALIREAGEGFGASTGTCILKEAGRQLIEEASA